MKAEPKRHHYSRRERIEQAIARGHSHDRIVRDLTCSTHEIAAAQARIDAAVADDNAADLIQQMHPNDVVLSRAPGPRRVVQPHGTHSAFVRHRNHGENPCEPCVDGERAYQAARYRAHRARTKGAA